MDGGNAWNRSGAFPCGQIYRKWISAVQQEYGRYLERFDLVMKIQLDMYQTLAAAVLVLMLGAYLKSKIHFLEQFCIPGSGCRWFIICHFHLHLLRDGCGRVFL